MKGWKPAVLLLAAAVLCSACGCRPLEGKGQEQTDQAQTILTIGTADSGGTMYPVGSAIAHVLEREGLKINVGASSGSAMNVDNLLIGETDLALVSGDTALAAYEEPDGQGGALRAIGAVFFSQSNWLAGADSDLAYVHDLAGLRLGVGPEHSSTEMSALAAIRGVGIAKEDAQLQNCGLGSGTEQLRSGELDAIHAFSGAPISSLAQLAEDMPCRVLAYTPEELDAILSQSRVFIPVKLPAGTYRGQNEELDTFGVKCLLCVDVSMDEELVYELTRSLWQAREQLGGEHPSMKAMAEEGFVNEDLLIPLHPGAERFYEEMK